MSEQDKDAYKKSNEAFASILEYASRGELFKKGNTTSETSASRNFKTEKNAHTAATKLSKIAERLSSSEYQPTMEDIAEVLDAVCGDWYGRSIKQTIETARQKNKYDKGWGLTPASITTDDYNVIREAWTTIKEKCTELLCSDFFSSEMYLQDYPNSTRAKDSLVQFIDKVIAIAPTPEFDMDRARALSHVNVRLYSAFYGKEATNFSLPETDGMGTPIQ